VSQQSIQKINELSLLNSRIRSFEGVQGLRNVEVNCIARDGLEVKFATPLQVYYQIGDVIIDFDNEVFLATGLDQTALACAKFWMRFVALHPFHDGNGRTGKSYILKVLKDKGYAIKSFGLLNRYLIKGNVEKDMLVLKTVFKLSIEEK
jgi:Fic family protein